MGLLRWALGVWVRGSVAASENRTGEVSNAGYDNGEVITAFPEAIIGGLVAEYLKSSSAGGLKKRVRGKFTSMRPTTMDNEGIYI